MGTSATGSFVPGSTLRLAWAQSGGWAVHVQTLREDLGDADIVADFRETSCNAFWMTGKNNCMYVGTNSGQEDMKRPKNLNLHFEEPGTKAVIALNITKGGRHPEMLRQVGLRKHHYEQS